MANIGGGTLELSSQAKARMAELLSQILMQATCDETGVIDYDSYERLEQLERVPSKQVQTALGAVIGQLPVSNFVFDELFRRLAPASLGGRGQRPVAEIIQDVGALSANVIDALNSFPRRYVLTVEMPRALVDLLTVGESSIVVGDGIRLVKGSEFSSAHTPLQPAGCLGALFDVPGAGEEAIFLQIEFDGFVGQFGHTETLADIFEDLQAFIGALIGFGVVAIPPLRANRRPLARKYAVHQTVSEQWELIQTGPIDPSLSELIDRVFLSGKYAFARHNQSIEAAEVTFQHIGRMLRKREGKRLHGNMVLGSKWLLDSYLGQDPILRYVQATVAIETLLGEKTESDTIGLGALLGNRCAYLIARCADERRELLVSFKEIYKVRCEIVHQGRSRLTVEEGVRFHKLHKICGRVLVHEVLLLSGAQKDGR